jgi:hypothetical protein
MHCDQFGLDIPTHVVTWKTWYGISACCAHAGLHLTSRAGAQIDYGSQIDTGVGRSSVMMKPAKSNCYLPIGAAIMRCRLFALPSATPLISDGPRL